MKYYLLRIHGDIEPELIRCRGRKTRHALAQKIRDDVGKEDGLYSLDVDACGYSAVGTFEGDEALLDRDQGI